MDTPTDDLEFKAFAIDAVCRLRALDPDDLVNELGIDTDNLIGALGTFIYTYIQEQYYGNADEDGE
jgi:hypothetical protein